MVDYSWIHSHLQQEEHVSLGMSQQGGRKGQKKDNDGGVKPKDRLMTSLHTKKKRGTKDIINHNEPE